MKVKLSRVIDALEFINDEIEYYYNLTNGEILGIMKIQMEMNYEEVFKKL